MKPKHFKFFLLISILSANFCYANDVALVLGYQNSTTDELWQQKQIGFGVKNLVQQNLMDNTNFSLLDEKVISGISSENIEDKLQSEWMLDETKVSAANLEKIADEKKAQHLFWVKIKEFKTRTSKMSIGFLNNSNYEDTLVLEVCHYVVVTKNIDCKEGEANESRTLNGVLYKPTEKVNFKESGARRLSQEAINQALSELLPHE